VVLVLLVSGCTVTREGEPSEPTSQTTTTTTTSEEQVRDFPVGDSGNPDDDTVVHVGAGEEFTISVEDNASVGDMWSVSKEPDAELVTADGDHYVADSETPAPGSGGTRYFEFTARAEGSTTIELRNCFRGCAKPEDDDRYLVSVEVG
jgi:predicted secreted protein